MKKKLYSKPNYSVANKAGKQNSDQIIIPIHKTNKYKQIIPNKMPGILSGWMMGLEPTTLRITI